MVQNDGWFWPCFHRQPRCSRGASSVQRQQIGRHIVRILRRYTQLRHGSAGLDPLRVHEPLHQVLLRSGQSPCNERAARKAIERRPHKGLCSRDAGDAVAGRAGVLVKRLPATLHVWSAREGRFGGVARGERGVCGGQRRLATARSAYELGISPLLPLVVGLCIELGQVLKERDHVPEITVSQMVLPGRHARHLEPMANDPVQLARSPMLPSVYQRTWQRLHTLPNVALGHPRSAVALYALVPKTCSTAQRHAFVDECRCMYVPCPNAHGLPHRGLQRRVGELPVLTRCRYVIQPTVDHQRTTHQCSQDKTCGRGSNDGQRLGKGGHLFAFWSPGNPLRVGKRR